MKVSGSVAAGFVALAISIISSPASAQLDPVHITAQGNEFGMGGRFRLHEACATITAAHVVASTSFPKLSPNGSPLDEAEVVVADENQDIAIIRQDHEDPSLCAPIPSASDIERAIRTNTRGRLWLSDTGGSVFALDVELRRRDNRMLEVTILPGQSETTFRPGFSGAMVVFNDVPVAIVTDALLGETPTARATRLDRIIQEHASALELDGTGPARPLTVQEQLASVDPDVQLQGVISALGGDNRAMRRRAVTIGLASPQNMIRSVTIGHLVCAKRGLVINSDLPQDTFRYPNARKLRWAYGSTRLSLTDCNQETGAFSVSIRSLPGQWNMTKIFESPDGGQISASGVTISFNTGYPTSPGNCTVKLELANDARLEGTMTCQDSIYVANERAWIDLL